jgi:hypothetical protein
MTTAVEKHLEGHRDQRQDRGQDEAEYGLTDDRNRRLAGGLDDPTLLARERKLQRRFGLDDLLPENGQRTLDTREEEEADETEPEDQPTTRAAIRLVQRSRWTPRAPWESKSPSPRRASELKAYPRSLCLERIFLSCRIKRLGGRIAEDPLRHQGSL